MFVGGDPAYSADFIHLLSKNIIETIVLRNTVFSNMGTENVSDVLKNNGFVHQKLIGDYIVEWK